MSPTTGHDTIDRLMPAVYDELREVASRCFGSIRDEEIASDLGVTVRTVQRDWSKARTRRRRALDQ